jgi:hypothetical protein
VAETTVIRLLCCGFQRTGKAMGHLYQCWWRICREKMFFPGSNTILWHVNPLLGNGRNIHTANNTGAVFSLCPCSLRMLDGVTQQYWSCFLCVRTAYACSVTSHNRGCFLCGPCGAYITRICCGLDEFSQEKGNTTTHISSVVGRI